MELLELVRNIQIIFEKEVSDLNKGQNTFYTISEHEKSIFKYPNAETLIDLFLMVKSDEKLKSYFVNCLKNKIIDSDEASSSGLKWSRYPFVGISQLCFYALLELNYTEEAIDSFDNRKHGCEGIFSVIYRLIPTGYFDLNQLNEIAIIVRKSQFSSIKAVRLDTLIIEARYELLKMQIKKVNIEINQDKKTVSEKILQFGFDKSYNELLNEIDNFINNETSKIVNAGMISNLRTFIGNLLKEIANKIAKQKSEIIPIIKDSEMGNIRSYLKINLKLSDKDDKLIDSFVDILHKEGGHSFTSEKEYFRLARNIAIEIALFILTKYEREHKP